MIIIGKECPPFKAEIIQGLTISSLRSEDLRGKHTLLFFYAVDFSAVCPTELYSLEMHKEEFAKRNVQVIGVSVDSIYVHGAWLRTPREQGGLQGVTFPLLSDISHNISKSLGTYDYEQGLSQRGTFLIDPDLIVQYGSVNNMAFGRSTKEILRIIDAIEYVKKEGGTCPANWMAVAQAEQKS